MAKIVALEGTPGAGKTSVITKLTKDDSLINNLCIPELNIDLTSEKIVDDLKISKLYLDAEINKAKTIRKALNKYEYIFLDRTFLTTLAYSCALSKKKKSSQEYENLVDYFKKLDKKYDFPRPNYLVYLTIPLTLSLARRADFSHLEEFKNWFDLEFLKYFTEFYKRNLDEFKMPKPIFIDTTKLSEGALIHKITESLK
jgi:thymidylate kinase